MQIRVKEIPEYTTHTYKYTHPQIFSIVICKNQSRDSKYVVRGGLLESLSKKLERLNTVKKGRKVCGKGEGQQSGRWHSGKQQRTGHEACGASRSFTSAFWMQIGGILDFWGCHSIELSLKQQKLILLPFWRLEVKDQGVNRVGFSWGNCPWCVGGCLVLPVCSWSHSSVGVYA